MLAPRDAHVSPTFWEMSDGHLSAAVDPTGAPTAKVRNATKTASIVA